MSLFSRAAAFAAGALVLLGLAQSAPGLAAEFNRAGLSADTNTPALSVPSTDPVLVTSPTTLTPETTVSTTAPVQAFDTAAATTVDAATPDKFRSLADAVAAQDVAAADENLRCLASAIYFESKGEPVAGQLAVAEVIINRAHSGRFASDLCGVVKQRGQFSFVRGGVIPDIDTARPSYRTALAVAKVAMSEAWESDAEGALFFHARRVAPSGRFVRVASIGNHVFYR